MTGLYIHIPFCESRCIYCGFYSTTRGREAQDAYVDALCHEMELRRGEVQGEISTVYIGGGTPSILTPKNIQRIFKAIEEIFHPKWNTDIGTPTKDNIGTTTKDNCGTTTNDNSGSLTKDHEPLEVTMECNPDDVTPAFCEMLRGTPVNRVSMGAQTFSDDRLRFLHRRHTAREVPEAVATLRRAGIGNVSIDLMFAFPGETLEEWSSDIDHAIALRPEHLSAYSLQYEEGTPLYRLLESGRIHEIDDELYRRMYSLLCDRMQEAGYDHYEISNFALPGRRSRHNSSYWHNIPYVGLGASAHSYSGTTRSWNVSSIKEYTDSISRGKLPSEGEAIDIHTHYDDTIMTALRTLEGIRLDDIPEQFRTYLLSAAQGYINDGEMHLDGGHLALTRKGIFVSDMIMSDLMLG